jgi:3-hydroxy-9,10-secoandrosta-1,3,5(10)-triene-9,17-dione monooxygenase
MTDQIPDRDELVGRATALREQLWTDAAEGDRQRHLTEGVFAAVADAGLLRLMTPRRLGGYAVDMPTFLDVVTELGRGCPAAAWVTSVLNVGNFVVSLFPEAVQDQVWADAPDASTALVLGSGLCSLERVDGGVRVSGEWPYASGSLHCDWAALRVASGGSDGERPISNLVLLPAHDVEVKDTWHMTGMRGTGSGTIVVDDAFVPDDRILPLLPLLNREADDIVDTTHRYRNSLTGVFGLSLIAPLIGAADAALQYVQQQAPNRHVAASKFANVTESPTFQLDLAAATVLLDTAKLHARRIGEALEAEADAGGNPDWMTRARLKMDSALVAQRCRETIDTLITAYGTSAFHEDNPLQRIWRDINVGSRHIAFGLGIPEQIYGRALVGGDPREVSYIV